MIKEIKSTTKKCGKITIPITRTDNALCLRFAIITGTDAKGREWCISHSGGSLVIDVPDKHRHYSIKFEDILREVVIKEEG